jgi:hypothetical protein
MLTRERPSADEWGRMSDGLRRWTAWLLLPWLLVLGSLGRVCWCGTGHPGSPGGVEVGARVAGEERSCCERAPGARERSSPTDDEACCCVPATVAPQGTSGGCDLASASSFAALVVVARSELASPSDPGPVARVPRRSRSGSAPPVHVLHCVWRI